MSLPEDIDKLSMLFSSLPGIGPKLSMRLAIYVSLKGKDVGRSLSDVLDNVVEKIHDCPQCGNITTEELCYVCKDPTRSLAQILIVEDPIDLESMNSTGEYKGQYHVLGGVISPVNGIGPEELKIKELVERIKSNSEIKEVIFALNPTIEGDATSMYIKNQILAFSTEINISKLAKGIPVGGDIEFVSAQTLMDSLKSRVDF